MKRRELLKTIIESLCFPFISLKTENEILGSVSSPLTYSCDEGNHDWFVPVDRFMEEELINYGGHKYYRWADPSEPKYTWVKLTKIENSIVGREAGICLDFDRKCTICGKTYKEILMQKS